MVNFYEDALIWNWWADPVDLSDLAIVKNKNYFNSIIVICLVSGIIYIGGILSTILHLRQERQLCRNKGLRAEEPQDILETDGRENTKNQDSDVPFTP